VESVRCLPPAVTSANSPSRASGTSRTRSCGPWATSRARNSDNTEASKPGSLSDIPSAYFHEIYIPHRLRGLPISQILRHPQHRDQREAPR
jgi:hypothetical protein